MSAKVYRNSPLRQRPTSSLTGQKEHRHIQQAQKTPTKDHKNSFEEQSSIKKRSRRLSSEASTERSINLAQTRNFFTLHEDGLIVSYWLQNQSSKSVAAISKQLCAVVPGHSKEAIRDRIKRYLSKLNNFDKEYILDESSVAIDLIVETSEVLPSFL